MAKRTTPKPMPSNNGAEAARKKEQNERMAAHVSRALGVDLAEDKKANFKTRLENYVRKHGRVVTEDESLKPEDFADWEDLEDYVKYRGKTVTVDMKARHAPRRKAAKPPRRRPPASKPAGVPMSELVTPGWYAGTPVREIVTQQVYPEIDLDAPKFRRQRVGVGKCTGNKLDMTQRAFLNSYYLAESARREVRAMRQSPDARLLWHASTMYEASSLGYWFGADYQARQINRMLTKIEAILDDWSLAFCAGFRGLLPVFIRCKSYNNVGDSVTFARHIAKNTIELLPRYFDQSQNKRVITLLHEMGHHASAALKPRDERHDLCTGGWNSANNMCYRERDEVDSRNELFLGGNPRTLAMEANGNTDARKAALNNIDNYVCYMWNRGKDRGGTLLSLGAAGAKPSIDTSKPTVGSRSKPSS